MYTLQWKTGIFVQISFHYAIVNNSYTTHTQKSGMHGLESIEQCSSKMNQDAKEKSSLQLCCKGNKGSPS